MILYSEAPHASIKLVDHPQLIKAISESVNKYDIRVAVETGTYLGTGSTRIIAQILLETGRPLVFQTIEVNFHNWLISYQNLLPFPFVDSRWGCSIDFEGGLSFIRSDPALRSHHQYPEVYVDDIADPVRFYADELTKGVGNQRISRLELLISAVLGKSVYSNRMRLWSGESLLPKFLKLHRKDRPFIILDSAGGCGFYEFQVVMDMMRGDPFLLLLDDVHHVKHFRSLKAVEDDVRFKILDASISNGWALAWHE